MIPFHGWGLFVYDNIPYGLLNILWGPIKLIYWFIFIKLLWYNECLFFHAIKNFINVLLLSLGCVSYTLSVVAAFKESSVRRFFLYSSSSYGGLFLIFLAFGDAWVLTVLDYFVFFYILCVFSIFAYFELLNVQIVNFADLVHVNLRSHLLFIGMAWYLVGLPPFFSFFFKYTSYLYLFNIVFFHQMLAGILTLIIFMNVWSMFFYF